MLDAATGTGAVAILAARRGSRVVGMELATALLGVARARADEERVAARRRVAPGVLELFTESYGLAKAVVRGLDPARREEFHRTWVDFFESCREGDEVVHHPPYLLTLGTCR